MVILITRIIHDSSCIISIPLNVLLIVVILSKTPAQMRFVSHHLTILHCVQAYIRFSRNYSHILLVFVVIELVSASTCLFVFPRWDQILVMQMRTSIRIMSTESHDLNAITGPCYLTGFPTALESICINVLQGSSILCFISYAVMMHGHSHYLILLAFGCCYRYVTNQWRCLPRQLQNVQLHDAHWNNKWT